MADKIKNRYQDVSRRPKRRLLWMVLILAAEAVWLMLTLIAW